MYSEDQLKDAFTNGWDNCDIDQKVDIHNEIAISTGYDCDQIYVNDWDEEPFASMTPKEVACAICQGDYLLNQKYVWFDGYGNVNSFSSDNGFSTPFYSMYDYIKYYSEHPDSLPDEFEEFQAMIEENDNEDCEETTESDEKNNEE